MTRNVSSGTLNPTILYYLRSLENHRLTEVNLYFIPLDSRGNYGATSNNTKLVHWPLMGGLLHLVQLRPVPYSLYGTKCNSKHINGQCTNFVLFDVAP